MRDFNIFTYNVFETRWGIGAVVVGNSGIKEVLWPQDSTALETAIQERYGKVKYDVKVAPELCSSLALYFAGTVRQNFNGKLDIDEIPEFHRNIYNKLRNVPSGKLITYSTLAKVCGSPRAPRAVGNALARNPFPIVVP